MKVFATPSSFLLAASVVGVAAANRDDRTDHPADLLRLKTLEMMELRRLQSNDTLCLEEHAPEIHHFDIGISLAPSNSTGPTGDGVCEEGDAVLLGHDLNLLLLAHGLGELLDNDSVLGMGGVCPFPDAKNATDDVSEASMRRNLGWASGFVYRGAFSCGWFCHSDDNDGRRLQFGVEGDAAWFDTVYAPTLEANLAADIQSILVPSHLNCLGSNPNIDVELVGVEQSDFDMMCDQGEAVEFLDTINLDDFFLPQAKKSVHCGNCVKLDFALDGGDRALEHGDWVDKFTWKDKYGVTISATAPWGDGYVPNGVTRVFNSNLYGTTDKDLRSPHRDCPGGGPGKGRFGGPGQPGEKCHQLGNILLVQDFSDSGAALSGTTLDLDYVDDSSNGGIIQVDFDKPVLFSDVGVIDVSEGQRLNFKFTDGTSETFTYEGFGDGAVQRVIANKKHVVQVEVIFRGGAAITEMSFCEMCETIEEGADTCDSTGMVAFDNFEGQYPLSNWWNGKADTDDREHFSRFLGRIAGSDPNPYKLYDVPVNATKITIELDFYQIDTWRNEDEVYIWIGNVQIPIGSGGRVNTMSYGATTQGTVSGVGYETEMTLWGADLGFSSSRYDRIHHITIDVPKSSGLYNNGQLKILFDSRTLYSLYYASAGWDNILVEGHFTC